MVTWSTANAIVIDTNLYIQAFRNTETRQALQAFQRRSLNRLALHGVVAMELAAGALTGPQQAAVESLITPFRERNRLLGVSAATYIQAGQVLAALRREQKGSWSVSASFIQDVILAASVREHRAILVTDNTRDFAVIRRHLRGVRIVPPWPTPDSH